MGSTRKQARSPRRKASQPGTPEVQLEHLQRMLDLVLAAALRGHLLPSERRVVKAHLEERRVVRHDRELRERQAQGPECPACHGPLPAADLPRCPHCKLLLGVIRPRRV